MSAPKWLGLALVVALAACNGDDKDGTDTSGTSYTFECEVPDPYDLGDPMDTIVGHEADCEDGAYYNPDVPTATSYFIGEFHWDECGTVFGKEIWVLYPNDTWSDLGGRECQVVWRASGVKEERVSIGNYSLNLSMVVDEDATTCADIKDFEYEQAFTIVYDVVVQGSDSTVYFTSGTKLGEGSVNNNHVTYVSGVNCKLF
ncbi:MAG: hypothetical protein H6735_12630 [Alphaproteobacteria bacterium]|nr:hypothetical protein [Alphaproteobacteria bacterium]